MFEITFVMSSQVKLEKCERAKFHAPRALTITGFDRERRVKHMAQVQAERVVVFALLRFDRFDFLHLSAPPRCPFHGDWTHMVLWKEGKCSRHTSLLVALFSFPCVFRQKQLVCETDENILPSSSTPLLCCLPLSLPKHPL